MQKASWILLTVVAMLVLLTGVGSLSLAYLGEAEAGLVGSTNYAELAAGREDVETALRGQRGTAASLALGYGVLLLCTIVGPYRRGRVWAWWAILLSSVTFTAAVCLRVVFLGTNLGVNTAVIGFVLVLVGLLLDFRRLSRPALR